MIISTLPILFYVPENTVYNVRGWLTRAICYQVASVWKHPESQYWAACFRDQNGRQRRISTKETNNKRALKIAEEFGRAAKTKRTLN